jgi:diguanylate cyclase (GGDEF)-like protein
MMQLHGAILRGLYAAGESIRLLSPEQHGEAFAYDPDKWYESAELERLTQLFNHYSNPTSVLERIGEELMRAWYLHGPGRLLAPTAIDFLRFQAGSGGYRSVVRGPLSETGDFGLVSLDEPGGVAVVRSTTIFDPYLELGIMRGALDSAGGILYAEVKMEADKEHYTVRFVTPENRHSLSWSPARPDAEWQLRYRVLQLEQRESYWNGINETLNEAFREMRHRATVDALTGVCSRSEFLRRLQVEHARAQRDHRPLSMLYLDLDHFKQINDHFGHGGGDAVLGSFGRYCHSVIRVPDVVGRLGGEEFGVLLSDAPMEQACKVAERIVQATRRLHVPFADREIRWTVSIGVEQLRPGQSAEALIDAADAQLLVAKSSGRNTVIPAPA